MAVCFTFHSYTSLLLLLALTPRISGASFAGVRLHALVITHLNHAELVL
jgi:hypothetical protein